jgi:hypothetical protein
MKLPKQAKPVMRKGSTAKIEAGVEPSFSLCEMGCKLLPEPAKSICKSLC